MGAARVALDCCGYSRSWSSAQFIHFAMLASLEGWSADSDRLKVSGLETA